MKIRFAGYTYKLHFDWRKNKAKLNMKILIFLSTVLWFFTVLNTSTCNPNEVAENEIKNEDETTSNIPATVDPLVLIYNDGFDFTTAIDIGVLKNIDFSTSPLRNPSQIVLLCPAETETELDIQTLNGHDETLFFVRNISTSVDTIEEIKCQNYFAPIYRWLHLDLEMGFRIFAEDGQLAEKMIQTLENKIETPNIYWYPFLNIQNKSTWFNIDPGTVHMIRAKMHSNDYTEKCLVYTFGPHDWSAVALEHYYEPANQDELFEKFQISQSLPYGHLVLHHLAPLQDNINAITRPAFCTLFNTVPIWQTVAEGSLRKVEQFIRKVADIIGFIIIETQAQGELSLLTNDQQQLHKVLLQLNQNLEEISVPQVVRKKLFYKVKISDNQELSYSLIVYIHNEPTEQMVRKCQQNVCSENGWHFATEEADIGTTYCCFDQTSSIDEPFNLNKVSILKDGTIEEISVVDALQNYNNFI